MRSILLVEPHADTSDLYSGYLRLHGFDVLTAGTTDEARARASTADLIVMETHLPASADGLAFIHALRRDCVTRRVPIVVVSAGAYREDAIRAAMAGCDLFLVKPCLPTELLRSVRRMLRRTAARRIAKAVTSAAHHRQQMA